MILTADYHTHTIYSHGKGTVYENALAAAGKGLKEIGISDHGFSHPAFGLRKRKLPRLAADCAAAQSATGVRVLRGIESNIIGEDGKVDLKPERYDYFDIFLAGIHKFVISEPASAVKIFLPDLLLSFKKNPKPSSSLIKRNTATFINVIKKNPVDVITHLNFCCFADAAEVAKAAADYGTYIEINSKKVHLTDEELYAVAKTGVKFVISSDAHSPSRVGEISLAEKTLARIGIDTGAIMNIDGRLPDFRFARFKRESGR